MPWPGDEHRVELVAQDRAIEMRIDKIDSWTCTPMPKQPIFYLFRPQRLAQKGILPEIDLRAGEIVRRTNVALQRNI